jgi:hypothetical protein
MKTTDCCCIEFSFSYTTINHQLPIKTTINNIDWLIFDVALYLSTLIDRLVLNLSWFSSNQVYQQRYLWSISWITDYWLEIYHWATSQQSNLPPTTTLINWMDFDWHCTTNKFSPIKSCSRKGSFEALIVWLIFYLQFIDDNNTKPISKEKQFWQIGWQFTIDEANNLIYQPARQIWST